MKEYNEDFRFEDGVLHVRLSGIFPEELLKQKKNLFQPLIEVCSTHKYKKALVDARDLQVTFDTIALFQAGEDAASLTRIGLRIAMLAREDMIDTFFSDVVQNRGGSISVFTEMDDALAWLHK